MRSSSGQPSPKVRILALEILKLLPNQQFRKLCFSSGRPVTEEGIGKVTGEVTKKF